jgi:hypothetical protein
VSSVQVMKLIVNGGQTYLALITKVMENKEKDLQEISVVRNFPDVFSTDYSGLPPERDQQDLVLGGFLFLSFGPHADSSLFCLWFFSYSVLPFVLLRQKGGVFFI